MKYECALCGEEFYTDKEPDILFISDELSKWDEENLDLVDLEFRLRELKMRLTKENHLIITIFLAIALAISLTILSLTTQQLENTREQCDVLLDKLLLTIYQYQLLKALVEVDCPDLLSELFNTTPPSENFL